MDLSGIMSISYLVPRGGFEPPACPLGGDRSILLSYRGEQLHFTITDRLIIFWERSLTNNLSKHHKVI